MAFVEYEPKPQTHPKLPEKPIKPPVLPPQKEYPVLKQHRQPEKSR